MFAMTMAAATEGLNLPAWLAVDRVSGSFASLLAANDIAIPYWVYSVYASVQPDQKSTYRDRNI